LKGKIEMHKYFYIAIRNNIVLISLYPITESNFNYFKFVLDRTLEVKDGNYKIEIDKFLQLVEMLG
jgi:hypothetical protein